MFRLWRRRQTSLFFLSILCGVLSQSALGEGFGSRYFLDPSRAEETLANIVKQPLLNEEWRTILQGREGNEYTTRRGDTLWDISSREFGDAFLWRKLWQINDYISNPHDIDTGQLLKFYREGAEVDPPILRVPVVKLTPNGGSDLDSGSFVNLNIKNRFRPSVLVVDDKQFLGEISGAYSEAYSLPELTELYLDLFNVDTVRIGEKFAVVRYERTLTDSSAPGSGTVGNLMRLVAEVRVVALGENLAKAEISSMFGTVRRGDRLIDVQDVVAWSAVFNPPDDLTARIVMGEVADHTLFGQGGLVLLNKGSSDGMKNGYLFRVFRDEDPLTGNAEDVEPDFKGEIQIVYTTEFSSMGIILRNKTALKIGDTLIANQLFADPPPPPRRDAAFISLD